MEAYPQIPLHFPSILAFLPLYLFWAEKKKDFSLQLPQLMQPNTGTNSWPLGHHRIFHLGHPRILHISSLSFPTNILWLADMFPAMVQGLEIPHEKNRLSAGPQETNTLGRDRQQKIKTYRMLGREQLGSKRKYSKGIESGGMLLQIQGWGKSSVRRCCLNKGLIKTQNSNPKTWEKYNMVFSTRGKRSGAAIFLLGKEKLKSSFCFPQTSVTTSLKFN